MRRLHTPLLFVVLTAGVAHSQILPAVYKPGETDKVRPVSYEDADARDYKHGTMMRITKTDNSKVNGTLVFVDRAADRLYIRTAPGKLPVAVDAKDIKKEGDRLMVQRAMRDVEKKPGQVVPVGAEKERVAEPEIYVTTVGLGAARSSSYSSSVLSPQEKTALVKLSEAEDRVARLEIQAMRASIGAATEEAIVTERLKTQQLLNTGLGQQLTFTFTPPYSLDGNVPYLGLSAGTFPALTSGIYYPAFGGIYPMSGWAGMWGGSYYGTRTFNSMYDFSYPAATAASAPPAIIPRPSAEVLTTALTKARDDLRVAQQRAIYEDGQLVAVSYEEPPKPEKKDN